MLEPRFCYNNPLEFLCVSGWYIIVIVAIIFLIYKFLLPKKKDR